MSAARIVLEFGLGGSRPGAVCGGVEEKTVNFLLGQLLAERLRQEDFSVLVTRHGDYDVPLGIRCRLISAEHQRIPIAMGISGHQDAFTHAGAPGFAALPSGRACRGRLSDRPRRPGQCRFPELSLLRYGRRRRGRRRLLAAGKRLTGPAREQ
jgi:N-acetylmuramoyl-L-alanine amidase